jgi:uncharacterized protein YndB with AHSA1/START domain
MYEPTPLADVRAEAAADDRWTLVFIRDFPHPPEKVWRALTDPGEIKQWAPYDASRDLARTGDATLTMVDGETRMDMPAVVTRSEPPTLLEFTWDEDLLRWELERTDEGTRLTLRHTLSNHDWVPKVTAGWHVCLDVADLLLAGRTVGPIRGQEAKKHGWEDLRDGYGAKLGIKGAD